MLTSIDESGDCRTSPRSKQYFRLAAICWESAADSSVSLERAEHTRAELGVRELHFADLSLRERQRCLAALGELPFRYAAVSFEKPSFAPGDLSKDLIIRATVSALAASFFDFYAIAEAGKPTATILTTT